jgi:tetratricopeptide (TPR) repeat protein
VIDFASIFLGAVIFAVLLARQNRFRDALTHFAAAAKLDPGRADVQVGQAEMLRNLGDLNASVLHWRRAVEIDPANAVAWAEGAKALIALKRYREARAWLDTARKQHPDRVELSALSADLAVVSGR